MVCTCRTKTEFNTYAAGFAPEQLPEFEKEHRFPGAPSLASHIEDLR